jgi:hypothetical protein
MNKRAPFDVRCEVNDLQEREDLIREIEKMIRKMDLSTLQKIRWNIIKKWGA